jgi:hypothetical protein
MEKLLKKESKFQWNKDYQKGLDTSKQKIVTAKNSDRYVVLIFQVKTNGEQFKNGDREV